MPIIEILARNAALYGDEISLVEINPQIREIKASWKEYELVETNPEKRYRREMTWREFDDKANRLANFLLERGLEKGHKVGILLMNCLEWLPIYFGILKTGAIAVPLNYRYTEDEIKYCLDLAECDVLIFGPEFTEKVDAIREQIPKIKIRLFLGMDCPVLAERHYALTACCYSRAPKINCCGSFLAGSKAVLLGGVKPEWIMRAVSEEQITSVWLLVPWAQDILD